MCGFSFLYSRIEGEGLERVCRASVARMTPRGPDSSGVEVRQNAVLGHARLSIVGLNDSAQPMSTADHRFTLVFNGEIYNYKELKNELAQGWQFVTTGDTEVLLAGLVTRGEGFIDRLEGMWGFALWDNEKETLLVSRDRMGKKPVYYFASEKEIGVSSELPSLNELSRRTWKEDVNSTADYFRYGYTLPGNTFFEGVFELPAGSNLTWTVGYAPVVRRYWIPEVKRYNGAYDSAVDELRFRLTAAVERRLVADVKVGTFLSGGVDSSVVSAVAAQLTNHNVESFTIGFRDASHDESVFAKQTADFLGIKNHCSIIDELAFEEFEKILLERVGQPFHDSSLVPTASVSALASKHVKVALSGDGADELFGGYERYRARKILNLYVSLPVVMRSCVRKFVDLLPEPESHHSRSLLKKLHLFMDVVDRREAEQPYVAPSFFSWRNYESLFPGLAGKGHGFHKFWESQEALSDIKEMMLSDTFVYLPQDIMTKVDRASMHHSLEVRAPFLDTSVVSLAMSLPIEWVHGWSYSKKPIKSAFSDRLPAQIWNRNKQGFAVPISRWFREDLGSRLEILLEEVSVPSMNMQGIKNLLEKHRLGRGDYAYRLWLVFVYLTWRKKCSFLEPS